MNEHLRKRIMERDEEDMRRGRDSRDYRDYEDYDERRDSRDYRDERDYDDYERDGRRGRRRRRDMHDIPPRLSKSDMYEWKHMMQNADGTKGEHYDMQEIIQVADKLGIRFDSFSEKELCLAVNMMYSDYCKTVKKYVGPEKELHFYVCLALDFLEDPDGPEASEKLSKYFHCVVNG